MNGLILSAAAVLTFSGLFWRAWDRRATAPMWLLGGAIVCGLVGGAVSRDTSNDIRTTTGCPQDMRRR